MSNTITSQKFLFDGAKGNWRIIQIEMLRCFRVANIIDLVIPPINGAIRYRPHRVTLSQVQLDALDADRYKREHDSFMYHIKCLEKFTSDETKGLEAIYSLMDAGMIQVLNSVPEQSVKTLYDFLVANYSLLTIQESDFRLLNSRINRKIEPSERLKSYLVQFHAALMDLGRDPGTANLPHAVHSLHAKFTLIGNISEEPRFAPILQSEITNRFPYFEFIQHCEALDNSFSNCQLTAKQESINQMSGQKRANSGDLKNPYPSLSEITAKDNNAKSGQSTGKKPEYHLQENALTVD
jgi:hypothetical protein